MESSNCHLIPRFVHVQAKLDQESLLRIAAWTRVQSLSDTKCELAVWGQTRYLPVTEAPQNTQSLHVSGEETMCILEFGIPEMV